MPVDTEIEEQIACTGTRREQPTHRHSGGGTVSMETQEAKPIKSHRSEKERFKAFEREFERRKYEWLEQLAEDRDRLVQKS
jgi:hypothetical protein